MQLRCVVTDPEGGAVTVSLMQTSGAGCLSGQSGCANPIRATFPAGSTSGSGAVLVASYESPDATKALFRCDAIDLQGRQAASRTACIPVSHPAGAITCP